MATCYINLVPRDILVEILVYLEEADLFIIRCVSRLWADLCHDDGVKKKVYLADMERLGVCLIQDHHPSNLLYHRSYFTLYPGIEKHLDLYHCLGRAVKRLHYPAVLYFLNKVNNDNLDVSEFATLIDFLATSWHPGIFTALAKRYLVFFRQHWHVSLFEKFKEEDYESCLVDFPKLIVTKRGVKCITRATYLDGSNSLVGGHKTALQGKKNKDFSKEEKSRFSYEIRNLIERLD